MSQTSRCRTNGERDRPSFPYLCLLRNRSWTPKSYIEDVWQRVSHATTTDKRKRGRTTVLVQVHAAEVESRDAARCDDEVVDLAGSLAERLYGMCVLQVDRITRESILDVPLSLQFRVCEQPFDRGGDSALRRRRDDNVTGVGEQRCFCDTVADTRGPSDDDNFLSL